MNMEQLCQFQPLVYEKVDLEHLLEECADNSQRADELRDAINSKTREIEQIVDFIYSLPPSSGRYGLILHCLFGRSWEEIALDAYEYDRRITPKGIECKPPVAPDSFKTAAFRGIQAANKKLSQRG